MSRKICHHGNYAAPVNGTFTMARLVIRDLAFLFSGYRIVRLVALSAHCA
jgi:hypothetical protein